ncbi:MAG TPA: enoyl-CoA hydratase-related protein [Bacteroidia bacterium]|jgi:2-(1,2-epoxy-1,2-dihydrophenyl)acetyl-CoA isomerase|nr:enoyl-CoA hydratase-related protein [Bacteroidia bacterium]
MSFILSHTEGPVLKLSLNRPDKFNSFNRAMALELQKELDRAATDNTIRTVYLTGEGKAFCAGQDLSEAVDPNGPGITKIVEEHYNPIILKIRNLEKPVVCAVNGVAAGAGANIALACDVIVAASSSSFIQAFSKIALIPDSGGTFFLPRLVGFQRALALCMLGDRVSAADALQMGMIYKVSADEHLQTEAMQLATTLAGMPTKGLGLTKRLFNLGTFNSLEKQLQAEGELQTQAASSHDYKEGVSAFLEKRKPVFKGN